VDKEEQKIINYQTNRFKVENHRIREKEEM
jgi:hypothetical protein